MTRELPLLLLLAGLGTLAAATLAVLWSLGNPEAGAARGTHWDTWHALPAAERAALVSTYQELQQREDARAALTAARRFVELPAQTQDRYRAIHATLVEVMDALKPTERRTLMTLPPGGRAAQLYRLMEARFPEKLGSLRKRPAGRG
jgi:hypothetical protein